MPRSDTGTGSKCQSQVPGKAYRVDMFEAAVEYEVWLAPERIEKQKGDRPGRERQLRRQSPLPQASLGRSEQNQNLNRTLFLRRSPFHVAVRFNRVITFIARLGIGARIRMGFRFSLALGLFVGLLFLLQLALPLFVRKIRFRHESPLFVV